MLKSISRILACSLILTSFGPAPARAIARARMHLSQGLNVKPVMGSIVVSGSLEAGKSGLFVPSLNQSGIFMTLPTIGALPQTRMVDSVTRPQVNFFAPKAVKKVSVMRSLQQVAVSPQDKGAQNQQKGKTALDVGRRFFDGGFAALNAADEGPVPVSAAAGVENQRNPLLTSSARKLYDLAELIKTSPKEGREKAWGYAVDPIDRRIEVQVGALRLAVQDNMLGSLPQLMSLSAHHESWYMRRESIRHIGLALEAGTLETSPKLEQVLTFVMHNETNGSSALAARWALLHAGVDVSEFDTRMQQEFIAIQKAEAARLAAARETKPNQRAKPGLFRQFVKAALLGLALMTIFNVFNGPESPQEKAPIEIVQEAPKVQFPDYSIMTDAERDAIKVEAIVRTQLATERTAAADEAVAKKILEQKKGNWFVGLLSMLLPIVMLVALFTLVSSVMAKRRGGMKGMLGMSKKFEAQISDKRFSDVAGIDDAMIEIQEIIDFLKNPARYQRLGAHIPKGVLLHGPPGTGKTLLAQALAGEADAKFFSISGSDFIEMFVGVGASRVRDLFEKAKANAPAIIFIDELDAVGKSRAKGGTMSGSHSEQEQTLNAILTEMDGFDNSGGVIVIAATNRPETLDPALMRPGRFDRKIVVATPDYPGREGILTVHAGKALLDPTVDLRNIARNTPGASGATLANVINEGALLAARENAETISEVHLTEAIDRMSIGQKRSLFLSQKQRIKIAYHESGHALTTRLKAGKYVHKLTIRPYGSGALGFMAPEPEEDILLHTESELKDKIVTMMGGRAAEELIYKEPSSGASNDLEQATRIAKAMVKKFGMGKKSGLMVSLPEEEGMFGLNGSETPEMIEEINAILDKAMAEAKTLLEENKPALEAMKDALLEKETLLKEDIEAVIAPFIKD